MAVGDVDPGSVFDDEFYGFDPPPVLFIVAVADADQLLAVEFLQLFGAVLPRQQRGAHFHHMTPFYVS